MQGPMGPGDAAWMCGVLMLTEAMALRTGWGGELEVPKSPQGGHGDSLQGEHSQPLGTAVRSMSPGLCRFLAVGPWASDLTLTCLTFPICDMGQQSDLPHRFTVDVEQLAAQGRLC